MRFSMISKKWVSGLTVAGLSLLLVGCSPESSTTTTTPTTKPSSPGVPALHKEQTGTSLGDSSIDKGREAPEPNAADPYEDEKPASEKPNK